MLAVERTRRTYKKDEHICLTHIDCSESDAYMKCATTCLRTPKNVPKIALSSNLARFLRVTYVLACRQHGSNCDRCYSYTVKYRYDN